MRHVHIVARIGFLTAAFALLALARGDETGRIVISTDTKAKKGMYPIAVPLPLSGDPEVVKMVGEVQTFDLNVSSWFKALDPKSFLADLKTEGMSIDPAKWQNVGAFGVIKTSVEPGVLRFKLYEVEKGATPVLEREYPYRALADARKSVHRWCNEVVKYYTGEPGFFGSIMTFSTSKKIMVMDFDGNAPYPVTKNDAINLLPSLSPDGGKIAFTSYMRGNPDLYVVPTSGGRPTRIAKYNGMNTGASWSPDGRTIALTLSKDGNAEIYLINAADGTVAKRLTDNRYIDTSPEFSPDGREIAFVSNREGTPQIYVMGADGSNQRRVSMVGSWNQTPSWSPRSEARVIAYTARDDAAGHFDIVTLDLASGKLTRITQNQGNNEEPTWSPNGRVLAFSSNRSSGQGIYLANSDGTGDQHIVYRGEGTSVDWGPLPSQQ
jgi:TolB protein